MSAIAVIGGTGFNQWTELEVLRKEPAGTPFGSPTAPLVHGKVHGADVIFLARHGEGHKVAPHAINYRANLWALHRAGVRTVVAVAAVGGIARRMPPAAVAVPHDLVDYTWGRHSTYCGDEHMPLKHVEFHEPYREPVRKALIAAARRAKVRVLTRGVMGVTQGPRLETAAEIHRLKRDGCDMVGMTSMPEAALAKELGLDYAALAVSVNWAAGIGKGDIHGEIEKSIAQGMQKVQAILKEALPALK